jgi:PHD/YefM family antitoxin component YafN of YafNO toxin-antitoxin module
MPETKTKQPDIIFREGKPAAVILDIDEYQELLEPLEDAENLAYLRELHYGSKELSVSSVSISV